MNKTSYRASDLRSLTDDELAEVFNSGSDAERDLVLRELARRDRQAATSRRDAERWAAVTAEWLDFAHAQFLAAEAECRGYLVNRAGRDANIDPWSLWSGAAQRAERYASEELRNFWAVNPRLTVSEFREHLRQDRAERD